MKERETLRKQIHNYKNGLYYNDPWYDWFCKDSSLPKKTEKLFKKILEILPSYKVDPDSTYVFFKNNCPMNGNLYDDFRICDFISGDVIFTVTPKQGFVHKKNISEIWGRQNNFEEPLVSGTWKDVVNFFKEI